ncbi:MAG: TrkH family potassium uptake protein [Planctomycetes bacterium]|nr:TrkH family potassium uptake protein [Planctomycetota bacterium]
MPEFTGSLVQHPARISLVWYLGLIVLGALALSHPRCHASGEAPITRLDACFTATSAACVTGLVVRSTGEDFSFLGQVVILALIQLGGIGIMTVTTYVTFQLGGRQSLRHRMILSETLGAGEEADLRSVLRRVLQLTFVVEGAGALVLLVRFLFELPPGEALWSAVFHAVSAYCNAGFALYDNSLTRYQGDVVVNLTVISLLVIGGIGYPVILDLLHHRRSPWRRIWEQLTLHSKIMILGTVILLALGTAAVLFLEGDGVLREMPWWKRLLAAFFHSASTRTAGFNTLDTSAMTNATLFLTMLLMMIGAGPCSTGGGFKVSTFMLLAAHAWSSFRGFNRLNLFRRTVPQETVNRAVATALVFSIVAIGALVVLMTLEQSQAPHARSDKMFLDAAFECVSALCTVGLSTGMTGMLSNPARVIIIALMFLGRLGPITAFAALARTQRQRPLEYVHDAPLFG